MPKDQSNLFDIALVGCGLHALTLFAVAPELLNFRVAVIEKGKKIGGGAMKRYLVTTNSNASKFFSPLAASPLFSKLFENDPILSQLSMTHHPTECELIGTGLELIGDFLSQLDNPQVFLEHEVKSIRFTTSSASGVDQNFALMGPDGTSLHAKACILATGRKERLHPGLNEWRERVILSSTLLEGRQAMSALMPVGQRRNLAVFGASHGAFSVLDLFLNYIDRSSCIPEDIRIEVFHRDDIRLYYPSVEDACREQEAGQEGLFDNKRDVCPQTGTVFRDSGLRGRAKEIYRSIKNGDIPNCRFVRIKDIEDERLDLSDYDYVIQALGATPNVPPLQIEDEIVWHGDGSDRINVEFDGRVSLPGNAGGSQAIPLFALRVVPTAGHDKDHNPDAQNVYARLASALEAIICTPDTCTI